MIDLALDAYAVRHDRAIRFESLDNLCQNVFKHCRAGSIVNYPASSFYWMYYLNL